MESKFGWSTEAIKAVINARRRHREKIRSYDDDWFIKYSGPEDYSARFYEVLRKFARLQIEKGALPEMLHSFPLDILSLLKAQKESKGRKVHVLDVMGYGQVIRDFEVDGAAIALVDQRVKHSMIYDNSHNINLIAGDVLTGRVWRQLDRLYPQGYFDFVLCSPYGALTVIPNHIETYGYLLSKIYAHLSSDDGILVTEVNTAGWQDGYLDFIASGLNEHEGITTLTGQSMLMLIKGTNAPKNFSELQINL